MDWHIFMLNAQFWAGKSVEKLQVFCGLQVLYRKKGLLL